MIHTIKYTLPEERDELHLAVHGIDYYLTLWDLDQWIRECYKYNNKDYDENETNLLIKIRTKIRELMEDRGISLNDVE